MTRIGIAIDRSKATSLPRPAVTATLVQALATFGSVEVLVDDEVVAAPAAPPFDIVFNAARHADDPAARAALALALERHRLPFSGSGSRALSITASRESLKDALRSRQVPTAVYTVVREAADLVPLAKRAFPLVVFHPSDVLSARQGIVVESAEQLEQEAAQRWTSDPGPLLVERYLPGVAFCCVMLGNEGDRLVLRPVSLASATTPTAGDEPRMDHVPDGLHQGIERVVIEACRALELRDFARVDVALSDTGVPHVIAADPLPDVTGGPSNPVLLAADAAGLDDVELIQHCLVSGARRAGIRLPNAPALDDVRHRTPPMGLRLRRRHA